MPYIEKTGMAIDSNADGLMYGVLVWAESDIQLATKIISEIENERVVIVLPNNISDYAGVAKEYRAIQKLIEQYRDKEIELLDELGYILEDRANILNAFIENTFFRFEKKMSSVYYKGEKMGIVRKAQLPQLLSQIIQDIYYRTPKIVNELINRNELSSTIKSARAKLLNALFSNISQKDFGLMGNGPEMNILRSLLVLPGIYVQNGDDYYLEYSCADEKTRAVLQAINDFILSADKGKNFEELYAILTKPEYHFGLKQGVIPVYLAVVFLRYKNHLVLRRKDRELPLSAVVMNDIIAAPEEYKIYLEKWNDEKETYIVNLENIFAQYIHSADKSAGSFAYLVKAMRRWYLQLTKYEVTTKNYCSSDGKIESLDISSIRFRNALSNLDINAYDFLFRQVKSIYNSELYSEVTQALRKRMLIVVIFVNDMPIHFRFARIVIFELKFVVIVYRVSVVVELNVANPRHFGISLAHDNLFEFIVSIVIVPINKKFHVLGVGSGPIEFNHKYFHFLYSSKYLLNSVSCSSKTFTCCSIASLLCPTQARVNRFVLAPNIRRNA